MNESQLRQWLARLMGERQRIRIYFSRDGIVREFGIKRSRKERGCIIIVMGFKRPC